MGAQSCWVACRIEYQTEVVASASAEHYDKFRGTNPRRFTPVWWSCRQGSSRGFAGIWKQTHESKGCEPWKAFACGDTDMILLEKLLAVTRDTSAHTAAGDQIPRLKSVVRHEHQTPSACKTNGRRSRRPICRKLQCVVLHKSCSGLGAQPRRSNIHTLLNHCS